MDLPGNSSPSVGQQLLMMYSDDIRHPLVADCDDWTLIRDALIDFYDHNVLTVSDEQSAGLFRLMLENIYVMGYQRGRHDAKAE